MDVIDVRIPKKDARGLSESVPPSYLQQYKASSSMAIVVSDAPSGADEVRDWARLEAFLKRKELDAVLKDCGTEPIRRPGSRVLLVTNKGDYMREPWAGPTCDERWRGARREATRPRR